MAWLAVFAGSFALMVKDFLALMVFFLAGLVRIFFGAGKTVIFTEAVAPVARVAVMVALPTFFARIFPFDDTAAMDGLELAYCKDLLAFLIMGARVMRSPFPRGYLEGENRMEPAFFLFTVNALMHTLL